MTRKSAYLIRDEPLELYDLDGDIGEENDVAADHNMI